MPVVIGKIERLFPHENFDSVEQNSLMNTIRIPKNIMYLSDKLPRPTYELASPSVANLRNTTNPEGYSLPAIPTQKRPKQKPIKNMYADRSNTLL